MKTAPTRLRATALVACAVFVATGLGASLILRSFPKDPSARITINTELKVPTRITVTQPLLQNSSSGHPTFIADIPGTYVATFTVHLPGLKSIIPELNVSEVSAWTNERTSLVTLDGSAAADPSGDALSFTWSLHSKPSSSRAIFPSNPNVVELASKILLSVTLDPSPLYEDSDGRMMLEVQALDQLPDVVDLQIKLSSEALKPTPSEAIVRFSGTRSRREFVLTPRGTGDKKLHIAVSSRPIATPIPHDPIVTILNATAKQPFEADAKWRIEHVIGLRVIERPRFLGLTNSTYGLLQSFGVFIGLPGVVLLLLSKWIEAKRAKLKVLKDLPKIEN